jgi:hypothetical protein
MVLKYVSHCLIKLNRNSKNQNKIGQVLPPKERKEKGMLRNANNEQRTTAALAAGGGGATETKACGGSALGVSTATVSGVKKVVARVFPDRLLRGTENIRVVGYVCWMGNSPSRTRSLLSGSLSAGWGMGRLKNHFSSESHPRCRERES